MDLENIYIGTAGWAYKDWNGIVYPPSSKKGEDQVAYLAKFFDLIEVNSSFYGHIRPQSGKLWCQQARQANPRFMFTAKLNRRFTHSPNAVLESTSAATIQPDDKEERLAKLGLDSLATQECLGAVLAQFPISFKNTGENRDYLNSLLARFAGYPMVVEVRHSSWNDEKILLQFTEKHAAFCNIDQPLLGSALRPSENVTSGIGYIRLHGRNYDQWFEHEHAHERYNYLYKQSELAGWKDKIQQVAKKTDITFVVLNNHFEGKAAVNALQLKHLITDNPVVAPKTLLLHYPEMGNSDFIAG